MRGSLIASVKALLTEGCHWLVRHANSCSCSLAVICVPGTLIQLPNLGCYLIAVFPIHLILPLMSKRIL